MGQQPLTEHFSITFKDHLVTARSHGLSEYHCEYSSSRDTGFFWISTNSFVESFLMSLPVLKKLGLV